MVEQAPIGIGSQPWYIGDDFSQPFAIVDAAGAAIDITGWTFEFTLRREAGAPDSLLRYTIANGGISVISAGGGTLNMVSLAADTASFAALVGQYALRRIDAGLVRTLAAGPATLTRNAGV